ncbi:MAG: DUF222 domain-containing protein [Actinomycetes bacterium]
MNIDDSSLALAEQVDALVAAIDVTAIADDDLRELVVQAERATGHLQAIQARGMLEMVHRANAESTSSSRTHPGDGRAEEFVADEVAVLLSCTRHAANLKLNTAWQANRFQALMVGWRAGALDATKVRVIAEGVSPLTASGVDLPQLVDDTVVDQLVKAAADYAATHTTGQLRPWLARRVITIDPSAAEIRRQHAMTERRVVITPGPDGMSELWALLPSVPARQIQQTLTKMAQSTGSDDPRTADQRRADTLCDLLLGHAAAPQIALSLVLTGAAGPGASSQLDPTAELAGVGTITAAQLVELLSTTGAPGSHGRVLPCDSRTGAVMVTSRIEPAYRPSPELDDQIRIRDLTCRFPGCRRAATGSASGVDVDHTSPWPAGATTAGNLACLCRRHHRLKHTTRWAVTNAVDGTLDWTTPTGRRYTTRPWQYADPLVE